MADLIAVCQNDFAEGDWWEVESAELQNGCIAVGCDCTPKVYANIDGPHILEIRYHDAEDGHTLPVGWSLEHPTRCRLDDRKLLDCEIQKIVQARPALQELGVGRYLVTLKDDGDTLDVRYATDG